MMAINIVGLFAGIIAENPPNDSLFSQLPLSTGFSTAQPATRPMPHCSTRAYSALIRVPSSARLSSELAAVTVLHY